VRKQPLWLDAQALRRCFKGAEACDVLERHLLDKLPVTPARAASETVEGGDLLLMPSSGTVGTGVKLVTVQGSNPARGLPLVQGVYVLFAPDTLTPLAFLDGAELTRIRTPAVSALAARHLARSSSSRLVLFGAGVQARAHAETLSRVLPVERVVVVDPTAQAAGQLAQDLCAAGIEAVAGEADAVQEADLICCCTSASEPLFPGDWLPAGVHLTAIGSYQPHRRELDSRAVARSLIIVEDRAVALEEAGDLVIPINEGIISPTSIVADLAEVVRGRQVRGKDEDITLFKSVGVAFEDLILAASAYERSAT
jgi:ornithine cyclodeaminase/alanine dehydrogenase-like protein (mu-crystallin family)